MSLRREAVKLLVGTKVTVNTRNGAHYTGKLGFGDHGYYVCTVHEQKVQSEDNSNITEQHSIEFTENTITCVKITSKGEIWLDRTINR